MSVEIGVFADEGGWRVALGDRQARFASREAALGEAYRYASLTRWRGGNARILVQDAPGMELRPIESSFAPRASSSGRG